VIEYIIMIVILFLGAIKTDINFRTIQNIRYKCSQCIVARTIYYCCTQYLTDDRKQKPKLLQRRQRLRGNIYNRNSNNGIYVRTLRVYDINIVNL